jgi:hypothetical protein
LRLDRLFAIKLCQLTARPAFSPEQLVEVGVNCLSIPVSARWMIKVMNQVALGGDGLPVEAARIDEPGQGGAMKWAHGP